LGPLLFNVNVYPLRQLLRSLGLKFHFYTDDTQIYIHFRPNETVPVIFFPECISKMKEWMTDNFRLTQIMLVGSPHQLCKAELVTLTVNGSTVEFQTKLKNLGESNV